MADRRLTRPRVVLPVLAALLVVVLLLTPTAPEGRGRLSSYSAEPGGARGLFDAARRLGWRVERRVAPFHGVVDSGAIFAVLDPPVPLTAGEVHRLLDGVRAGAGLLLVVQPGSNLSDSLRLSRSDDGRRVVTLPAAVCPDSLNRTGLLTWPGGVATSWWLERYPRRGAVPFTHVEGAPREGDDERDPRAAPSLQGEAPGLPRPATVGFPLGRGRVVAVADPDLLRNDVLRVCRWGAGIAALEALQWLGAAEGRRLVFDEYHQGYGAHGDPLGASARALVGTAPGRAVLQLAAAGLVLLAAAGVRAVPPVARRTIERRSALEHVGALARAYEQVGATRTVARRLVRGLRRRHAVGARPGGDDAFLHAVAARHPALADDVRRLERALETPPPRDELSALGDAVARIDQHLTPRS